MIRHLIALVIIVIFATFGIGYYLQLDDTKSCGEKPSDTSGCKTADAIVAISGGDTNARLDEAIKLFKNGWAEKLVLSGAAEDKTGPSNAVAMRNLAIESGVPSDSILIDEYAATTKQNAVNCEGIFKKNSMKSIILVTSAYHQRRASLEFHKHSDVKITNHSVSSDKDWSFWWWTTPGGWYLAGSELVKIIGFYVAGT